MRLPWSKIYRAFPELDGFTDSECQRFVLQATAQRSIGLWPVAAAVALGIPWAFFFVPLLKVAGDALHMTSRSPDAAVLGLILGEVSLAVGSVALSALITRDRLLISAIRRRVDNARCTVCRHSLLGLPLLPMRSGDEAVRCPECGAVMHLGAIGLRYGELIPRAAPERATPS